MRFFLFYKNKGDFFGRFFSFRLLVTYQICIPTYFDNSIRPLQQNTHLSTILLLGDKLETPFKFFTRQENVVMSPKTAWLGDWEYPVHVILFPSRIDTTSRKVLHAYSLIYVQENTISIYKVIEVKLKLC